MVAEALAGGAIATGLWEALGPTVTEYSKKAVWKKWKTAQWSKSEAAYKSRLFDLHSTTKLLGNPKAIRLDKIYTDVFVLDKVTAYRRLKLDENSGELKELSGLPVSVRRLPLLDIVRDRTRVYVLGKPGAGKSTFLKTLCLQCCQGKINRTPIFVSLKEWFDTGNSLESFIEEEFAICGFPDAGEFLEVLLQSGAFTLLLDGLDEIPPDNDARQKAITALTRFARKHSTAQIVLTCRIAAAEYSFDQFDYYEIADFTEEQQIDFVSKWYDARDSAKKDFLQQWNTFDNKGLRDLAKTPLLLALLCLAFDETLSFPKRRIELYQEATNALLRKWDSSRGIRRDDLYRTLSHIRREQLLSRIAATTFLSSKIFFSKEAATSIIDAYLEQLPPRDSSKKTDAFDILRAIEAQHGLLVERAVEIYSFSHLTLHEYFTAKYLVEASHAPELKRVVQAHFFEDSWREVFLMVASMLDDAAPMFKSVEALLEATYLKNEDLIRSLDQWRTVPSIPKLSASAREVLEPLLGKTEDLCFELAAQFHFVQCGDDARNRARTALKRIKAVVANSAKDDFNAAVKSAKLINSYLQACVLIVESLQVATISSREKTVEALVLPHRSAAVLDRQI